MILLSQLPKKITTRLSQKTKVSEKLLKIIFLGGILGFSFSLLIFKFAILSQLNQLELSRLSLIKNFPNLTSGISDPLQAFGQFITTNIFKNHQIFAMKLPGSLMLTLAIISTAATLYIKFRNRYLPYTYLLLTTTSPLIILLGHQSYIPGIDTLFLISVILASYFAIIATVGYSRSFTQDR